jgi:surface protein
MNAAKQILQESNYSIKLNKIFNVLSNNIQYEVAIKKSIDKICINTSFKNDSNKKEYESYFSLENIYSLNNEFSKYKSIEDFYTYFIKFFEENSVMISMNDNILNLVILVGSEKKSIAIFQLKEIQRTINDIYYLIYNFINQNQQEFNPKSEEIQRQKNDVQILKNSQIAEDMQKLKEENAKMHHDILSINQKIDSLIIAVDNAKNNQINKDNQPPKKDKNIEQQIKNLENKISDLTKENKELKDQLAKTKNASNYGETKTVKESNTKENKIVNCNDKNQNIIRAKFIIENINQKTRIMNCDTHNNDKQLSENFDIYVNGEKIPFSWEYQFSTYIHNIEYKLKNPEVKEISLSYMFKDCNYLRAIDFSSFDSSKIINMDSMFSGCSFLNSINFSGDFSNVTNLRYLFQDCNSLIRLDLSYFKTENVTDMRFMFRNCTNLKSLDLSNFNTSDVSDMSYMFYNCEKLKLLDISSFNTSNATNIDGIFNCCKIEELIINQQDKNLVEYLTKRNIKFVNKK